MSELPPPNPLVQLRMRFKDGSGLEWAFKPEVPQAKAMMALGLFAGELNQPLVLTPTAGPTTVESLAEAIEAFMAARDNWNSDWSSEELAAAILKECHG